MLIVVPSAFGEHSTGNTGMVISSSEEDDLMGMQDYEEATKIMGRYPDRQSFVGPRSESLIQAAEKALGLEFPPTYRRFLLEYGAGAFGSSEICGVIGNDFEHSSVPDAIWYTLVERSEAKLPSDLIIIHEVGDGQLFCLDLGAKENEEAPVVAYQPGIPPEKQGRELREVIAKDFGEFLLKLVWHQVQDWDSLSMKCR